MRKEEQSETVLSSEAVAWRLHRLRETQRDTTLSHLWWISKKKLLVQNKDILKL